MKTLELIPTSGQYDAAVISVHDGDTLSVGLLAGVAVRVNGINAPELNTDAGKAAQAALAKLLAAGSVSLTIHGREKYGRLLADVTTATGIDVGRWMVAHGFAASWDGKGPRPVPPDPEPKKAPMPDELCCIPKTLPPGMHLEAARVAREVNPVNAPPRAASLVLPPEHIALLTSKYWGAKVDLGVTFLDSPPAELRTKILAYAHKWGRYGNIRFRESAAGQVRLSRGSGGYWSYLGTDILSIPASQPTMNLEAFSLSTPDSEFDRVVCHEFGHTLGFPHEHEREEVLALLDVEKTVAWFRANVGWDRQTVMEQVFTPLDPSAIQATASDVRSIMTYSFPGSCTKSGQPIPGGLVIDATDGEFAARVYPPLTPPPPPTGDKKVWIATPNIPVYDPTGQMVIGYAQAGTYACRLADRAS